MSNHIIVCHFDENLTRKFRRKALVVRTTDYKRIPHIKRVVNEQNKLHCIWITDKRKSLVTVPLTEEWQGIPINLYLSRSGSFKRLVTKIPLLKQLSIRIFLSSDHEENVANLKILASLGIDCGIYFGRKSIDWDAMNDLMHYAVYNRATHAAIEPFNYIVSNYDPQTTTDFSSVYFDNPTRYIHTDKSENIFLTHQALLNGNAVAKGIPSIDSISNNQEYINSRTAWQHFFLDKKKCGFCPAWRICLGKFSDSLEETPNCREFFSDLMDASDFYRTQKQGKEKELCQL